ncbi:MAG: hypothetical protein AAGI54_04040 [Planctomycetota bacterium]
MATKPEKRADLAPTPSRPAWPYPELCRLIAHANGQWVFNYRGTRFSFGPWDDVVGALKRAEHEMPLILLGKHPRQETRRGLPNVETAIDLFLTSREPDVVATTLDGYRVALARLASVCGRKRIDKVGAEDYDQLKQAAKGRSPITRRIDLVIIRMFAKWCVKRFGVGPDVDSFELPTAIAIRRQRAGLDERLPEPGEVRKLIEAAKAKNRRHRVEPDLLALVLLPINGGYGPTDLCVLNRSVIRDNIIDHRRNKTYALRRCPLWPETIEAIAACPHTANGDVFNINDPKVVGRRFKRLAQRAGVDIRPYDLRYAFSTYAEECITPGADHAKRIVMGHVIDGVSEGYVRRFPDAKLWAVVNHVRSVVLG